MLWTAFAIQIFQVIEAAANEAMPAARGFLDAMVVGNDRQLVRRRFLFNHQFDEIVGFVVFDRKGDMDTMIFQLSRHVGRRSACIEDNRNLVSPAAITAMQ